MTTPYGTTTFTLSPPFVNADLQRYIEATDPLGQKERVEFNISTALTGVGSSLEPPHPSASVVNFTTNHYQYRNSYYWDKLQMKLSPGNHQKAHRYHWLHSSTMSVTSILESEVPPLGGRIFYNQTQATKYQYNAQGNVTRLTDPVGRETPYEYDTDGVDVVAI